MFIRFLSFGVAFCLGLAALAKRTLYIVPLPKEEALEGSPLSGNIVPAASPEECVLRWRRSMPTEFVFNTSSKTCAEYNTDAAAIVGPFFPADAPEYCNEGWIAQYRVGFTWSEVTRTCTPFSAVYDTTSGIEEEHSFLLDVRDDDQCQISYKEVLPKKVNSCRPGWTKLELTSTKACYRMVTQKEHEPYRSGQSDVIYACKKMFPFSYAASIHSKEENNLISKTFTPGTCNSECGVKIGLTFPRTGMAWIDGTPMDYVAELYKTHAAYCKSAPGGYCTHGGVYWSVPGNAYWNGADLNYRELLCKYTL